MQKTKKIDLTCFFLCCMLFLPAVNNFLNCIFQIGMQRSVRLLTPIVYVFLAMVGAFSYFRLRKKNAGWTIIILAFAFLLGISYFSYPEIQGVMFTTWYDLVYNPIYKIFLFCVPALIVASNIEDYHKLYSQVVKFSRVTLLIGVFAYVFVVLYKGKSMQYMVFSYFMITSVCACFENFIHKRKWYDAFFAIVGSVAMVLCGARGAIVSLGLYIILRFFVFYPTRSTKKRFALLVVLGLGILVLLFYIEPILLYVAKICEALGVDSRVITTLLEGNFLDGSGREKILEVIVSALKDRPFGYGLYGDRYVTGAYGWGGNTYAHNFILEIFCDFGFFGIFILLFSLIFFLYAMGRNRNMCFRAVVWILLPYGLFQLFFSSSFLENIMFYAMIGLLIGSKREQCIEAKKGA